VTTLMIVSARWALMMLAGLLHAARPAAAANAAGPGREPPSHPAVTVTVKRLRHFRLPMLRNPESRADPSEYCALW
jgi:hypothetical protein